MEYWKKRGPGAAPSKLRAGGPQKLTLLLRISWLGDRPVSPRVSR